MDGGTDNSIDNPIQTGDGTGDAEALRRLRETEQLAQCALDALASHLAVIDAEGKIIHVNASWRGLARANGYGRADGGVGEHYLAICNQIVGYGFADASAIAEGVKQVLSGQRNGDFYLEYRCGQADSLQWYFVRVRGFGEGEGRRAVLLHKDITALKENERLEIERHELAASVKSMEQVLGVVGHELRTPLAAVRAIAELLLTDVAQRGADWRPFVEQIQEQTMRMSDAVNNLLEMARLNSGHAHWRWGRYSLLTVCKDAIEGIRPLVNEDCVALGIEIEPPDLHAMGDVEAIRRLLINLLSNAVKHTSDGQITVRAKQAAVQSDADGGASWVTLSVEDSGVGIEAEALKKLGKPFALNGGQIGNSYMTGAGLGLAICNGIVAAHGGSLSVRSKPGQGTLFTARLRSDLARPVQPEATGTGRITEIQSGESTRTSRAA